MLRRYLFLRTPFATLLMLFCIELALEYRHFRDGWITPIFGVTSRQQQAGERKESTYSNYGPIEGFPFRSKILMANKPDVVRIWVASGSHAEHSRLPVQRIFPNLLCQSLVVKGGGCEVINGSKAGMGVSGNLGLLDEYADRFQPDFVLLYQNSLIIDGQQRKIISDKVSVDVGGENALFDFSGIEKLFQNTSAFQHLTDYIGGNIKLMGPLKASLPSEMDLDFDDQIMSFVEGVRSHGAVPILITFAASHNTQNIDRMPRVVETNFVRYNSYLSARGWVSMVEHYNELIRKIGVREDVDVIDLEKELHGKGSYFLDFVHFNIEGHRLVAKYVAQQMNKILMKEEIPDDI